MIDEKLIGKKVLLCDPDRFRVILFVVRVELIDKVIRVDHELADILEFMLFADVRF